MRASGSIYLHPKDYRLLHLRPIERREAYRADITYGTNNEFGFDYLRDNMKFSLDDYVQRELHYAIVDEVDNILIDEARTPLIISGRPRSRPTSIRRRSHHPRLRKDVDYTIDEKHRSATLTEEGIAKCERLWACPPLRPEPDRHAPSRDAGAEAHTLFKRDVDYVVKEARSSSSTSSRDGSCPAAGGRTASIRRSRRRRGADRAREPDPRHDHDPEYFRMYKKLAA